MLVCASAYTANSASGVLASPLGEAASCAAGGAVALVLAGCFWFALPGAFLGFCAVGDIGADASMLAATLVLLAAGACASVAALVFLVFFAACVWLRRDAVQ